MEAGQKYTANVQDYGVGETKTGLTRVWVKFAICDTEDSVFWNGVMKPGMAQEITLKTLETLGFKGNFEGLNEGHMSEALDIRKAFEIVIEANEYNGNTSLRVKFVNDPSKPRVAAAKLAPQQVTIKKAEFEGAWKAHTAATGTGGKQAGDDIPF